MSQKSELRALLVERSEALKALYAAKWALNRAQARERSALKAIDDYRERHEA